ncbi:Ribosomal RNA small subunit methyltransferase H [Sesamum angolense]|uniref:Ribosomal RNA small subunit methyltransferase H n=1 Tax=Sesamum angolense TaxID=2727404 RepID=A0AAE2BKT9_9LAMI|nr:Ribosomal RNA small subunit methyltransferase H [Sesamum angolense]
MALQAATAAKSLIKKLLFQPPSVFAQPKFSLLHCSVSTAPRRTYSTLRNKNKSEKSQKQKAELYIKRRTRSERELNEEFFRQYGNESAAHVPVMLGEVLDVFASVPLKSFVDCTLGAGGHSAAIIQAHPEMEFYVGLDVDPVAHQIAQAQLNTVLHNNFGQSSAGFTANGVQGILMDLGMSSMQVNNAERGFSVLSDGPLDMRMNPQASLKAEDILNFWPDAEVGRILRDYGEESNWFALQKKIVKARSSGGLHSTSELVDLIRSSTSWIRGGRQGWIKTATRVFQALRIAVNDELNTLKDSIHCCFESLDSGGRLAVISFHSLEDRIVKQAFLDIINSSQDGDKEERNFTNSIKLDSCKEKEAWMKQIVQGPNASILTKRPITPSESEEIESSKSERQT